MLCSWSRVRVASALLLLLIALIPPATDAAIPCNSIHNPCEEHLFRGSECKNGYCTNPFEGGCLKSVLSDEEYAGKYDSSSNESILRRRLLSIQRKRICNSEDLKSSPFCQPTTDDSYSEVRLRAQNWESAIATAWILQIILSEILDVPTTIETGVAGQSSNFYNEANQMDYGVSALSNAYASVQNAFDAEGGDCTIYQSENDKVGKEGYKPCAHVVPETWRLESLSEKKEKGVVGEPIFLGALALEAWYITKFSIERDSSLALYTGYQGSKNRQKLAERFKRPTTWGEYCTLISASNCSAKDDVANHAPADDADDGRYFVEGSYTGYFRENNCTKANENECTGHFMDYPCGWTTYFKQQAYHLDIALESKGNELSNGYTYSQMVEIWKAANATKSDLIGQWWKPDATFSSFLGTDSQLIRVVLPPVTEECVDARVPNDLQCNGNATFSEKVGSNLGACDERGVGLTKVVVGNLKSNIEQSKSPKTAMNPAYDLIKDFQISELQLDKLLLSWSSRGTDPNFDLRLATCKWVADNLEYIARIIPQAHPRAFVESSFQSSPIRISALVISTLAVAVTVGAAILVSKTSLIRKNLQIEFVYLLLMGLFFVAVGSLLLACMPSKGACISSVWLLNVGYTLVLVPTLVRVLAILRVGQAGKKFRWVKVDKKRLLKMSLGISALAAVFCALWTGFDPITAQEELSIADETNNLGETIVWVSNYCASESGAWFWVSFAWQGFLLITGSVLAFQMRSAPKIVNDTAELAFMLYTSFMFLILRIVLRVWSRTQTEGSLTRSSLQTAQSLLWSIDSVVNTCIYFSKLFRKDEDNGQHGGAVTVRGSHIIKTATSASDRRPLGKYEEEKVEEDEPTQPLCRLCGTHLDCSVCGPGNNHCKDGGDE